MIFACFEVSASELVFDENNPITSFNPIVSGHTSGVNATINVYDGLNASSSVFGIKSSSGESAENNSITINSDADRQWMKGSFITGIYVNTADAIENTLELNGGAYAFKFDNGAAAAKVSNAGVAYYNTLKLSNVSFKGSLAAAEAKGAGIHNAVHNTVVVESGKFSRYSTSTANTGIYGVIVQPNGGSAEYNKVVINGGEFEKEEIAALNLSSNNASKVVGNVVEINGGEFTQKTTIYGVKGDLKSVAEASGNGVVINGGTFTGETNIYSVYGNNGILGSNFIQINADKASDLRNVKIHGSSLGSNYTGRLIINKPEGVVLRSVYKILDLELQNVAWQNERPAVSILYDAQFKNISINPENGFVVAENQVVSAGDSMTLVGVDIPGAFSVLESESFESETVYTQANVARSITGQIVLSEDQTKLDFIVQDVELAEQAVLIGENRAAVAAFMNEGSDAALSALSIPEALQGFSTFAAVQGSASKYEVDDRMKINGWHYAAGVHGSSGRIGPGSLSAAAYFEGGSGNYRAMNSFNEEFFRGDGEVSYAGGGLAVKYRMDEGFYLEGSLRAGEFETKMNNAVRNTRGELLGYESDAFYWGGHAGFGRTFENSAVLMDAYGRFYWTEIDGDSFTLSGDKFEFSDISSRRIRLGSRVESKSIGAYIGAAFEYEFDGDAAMTAAGIKAPDESLKGASYLAELGWRRTLSSIPLTADFKVDGWAGERSGVSGRLFLSYEL